MKQEWTDYDKTCYILAIYRGAAVCLEPDETDDGKMTLGIVEKVMVGLEIALRHWQLSFSVPFEARLAELLDEVGEDRFSTDVSQFLRLTRMPQAPLSGLAH